MKSRREFIQNAGSITLGVCCLGGVSLLNSCKSLRYVNFTTNSNQLVIAKTELGEDDKVLISDDKAKNLYLLRKVNEYEYTALLLLCTHKGCQVKPAGSIFVCPCHGSEFNKEGEVLQGPAVDPLMKLTTTSDNTNVYINVE